VAPTTLDLGAGLLLSSDASSWNGAAIVIPATELAPEWNPPEQLVTVAAGPAVGVPSGDEGSALNVPLRLSHAASVPVTVEWTFDGRQGSTLLAPGETTGDAQVTLPHDDVDGPSRSLLLSIVSVDGGVRIQRRSTAVEVLDVDPPPSIEVAAVTFDEGDTALTDLTVELSLAHPSGWDTRLRLVTQDDTAIAGVDYLSADLLVPFAAGETSKQVHLTGIGNTLVEPDRRLTLELSGETQLDPGTLPALVTIHDDDPVELLVTSDTVEAGQTATLQVSAPELLAGESVDVEFTTVDGSAVAGTDFTTEAGLLTLTAEEGATINVQTSEAAGSGAPDLEVLTFYVRLTSRPGARAVFSPPLAAVGITVAPGGEGGAANAGGSGGEEQVAGSPALPTAGAGGDDSNEDGRASARDDGGCGCSFPVQRTERAVLSAACLLLALLLRRSRSRRGRELTEATDEAPVAAK
jgi:hypothetical protein